MGKNNLFLGLNNSSEERIKNFMSDALKEPEINGFTVVKESDEKESCSDSEESFNQIVITNKEKR